MNNAAMYKYFTNCIWQPVQRAVHVFSVCSSLKDDCGFQKKHARTVKPIVQLVGEIPGYKIHNRFLVSHVHLNDHH